MQIANNDKAKFNLGVGKMQNLKFLNKQLLYEKFDKNI